MFRVVRGRVEQVLWLTIYWAMCMGEGVYALRVCVCVQYNGYGKKSQVVDTSDRARGRSGASMRTLM